MYLSSEIEYKQSSSPHIISQKWQKVVKYVMISATENLLV